MEILTGIMIAGFIYYTGFMVANGEIEINNFFSFLTAMMLAYQPIRSLATINMLFYQGAAGAERVFSVLDTEANIKENNTAIDLKINKGNVEFNNVSFLYIPGVENIQNFRDYNLPVMYPPGFVYILFFFNKINNFLFQLEYNYLFKSILIFFDLTIVLVLSYIYNNKIKEIIFFFWLNPVIFLCGSALGYIDIIPYSFLLFSILLILIQKFILSSMFFIASCSVKQLGIIILPIYFIYFLKKKNLSYNLKLYLFLFLLIVLGFFPVLFSATNFSIFQTGYGFI